METNWELIARFLSGEASKEEESNLLDWRSQSIENQQLYQEMYQIWHTKKEATDAFDSQKAFEKLTKRVKAENPLTVSYENRQVAKKQVISLQMYKGIAATCIFCLVALGAWWLQKNETKQLVNQPVVEIKTIEKINPRGQKLQLRLPDGTKVWLNAESKLSYPSHFKGVTREVVLEGEAFFDVTHQPQKPFVITTPSTKVEVLGTSFNVRAFADEKAIETVVVTGKVKIAESKDKENFILLNPNEKGDFSVQSKKMSKQKVNAQDYIGWKEGILKFENESIAQIIKVLEKWYGVTITVNNPIVLSCHLTGDFKNESLENVLIFMEKAINIQFEINHKEVKIKGKGCK
jgi:ferric-dicitrate binding protein FerR (iron transport regulator)